MREKIKKILLKEQYSESMIRACLNGNRKPNPEIRNRLRRIVPFEIWGLKIRAWLDAQEQKANKG